MIYNGSYYFINRPTGRSVRRKIAIASTCPLKPRFLLSDLIASRAVRGKQTYFRGLTGLEIQ